MYETILAAIVRSNASVVTKDDNMKSSETDPERPTSSGEFQDLY